MTVNTTDVGPPPPGYYSLHLHAIIDGIGCSLSALLLIGTVATCIYIYRRNGKDVYRQMGTVATLLLTTQLLYTLRNIHYSLVQDQDGRMPQGYHDTYILPYVYAWWFYYGSAGYYVLYVLTRLKHFIDPTTRFSRYVLPVVRVTVLGATLSPTFLWSLTYATQGWFFVPKAVLIGCVVLGNSVNAIVILSVNIFIIRRIMDVAYALHAFTGTEADRIAMGRTLRRFVVLSTLAAIVGVFATLFLIDPMDSTTWNKEQPNYATLVQLMAVPMDNIAIAWQVISEILFQVHLSRMLPRVHSGATGLASSSRSKATSEKHPHTRP